MLHLNEPRATRFSIAPADFPVLRETARAGLASPRTGFRAQTLPVTVHNSISLSFYLSFPLVAPPNPGGSGSTKNPRLFWQSRASLKSVVSVRRCFPRRRRHAATWRMLHGL